VGEFVRLEVDRGKAVGTIRLDRPPVNAMNPQIWREIGEVAGEAEADEEVRAVVIWGGPDVCAAGADIEDLTTMSFQDMRALGPVLQASFDRVAKLPLVTVAAVNGYALGGGCELALTGDLRFLAEDARIGLPEIKLGILPGAGGTQRLQRIVGQGRAKEMIYTGRHVDADEAERIGLAHRVVPADEVYETAVDVAAGFASGPYALRLAKQSITDGGELPLDEALRLESALLAECFATDDAAIGLRSFLDNGPGRASFTGR
jgi:enoyl-CoA hydratase/carnithine racemase